MYQKSFEVPTMWSRVCRQKYHFGTSVSGKSGKWKSSFALRAHFVARSVHVLSIALSRNKYGLFPLNCIQIAFWPATSETPQQSNKCSREVRESWHGCHCGLYVHSRNNFIILAFLWVNFIAVWIIRIAQLTSTCLILSKFCCEMKILRLVEIVIFMLLLLVNLDAFLWVYFNVV